MTLIDPIDVMGRLQEIDADLASRQNEWAKAAEDYARAKREYEYAHAKAFIATSDSLKVDERKAHTLIALVKDGTYAELIVAEAAVEAHKAAFNVLDRRASIGQSLLRAMSNEAQRADRPQPQWSAAA